MAGERKVRLQENLQIFSLADSPRTRRQGECWLAIPQLSVEQQSKKENPPCSGGRHVGEADSQENMGELKVESASRLKYSVMSRRSKECSQQSA